MSKLNKLCFFIVIIIAAVLIIFCAKNKLNTPLKSSLSPAFTLAGKPIKTIDNTISKALPINDQDEEKIGKAIIKSLHIDTTKYNPSENYLNKLINDLEYYKKKKFNYRIIIIDQNDPNAMALPGGVILITESLLKIIKSESEIVSIIAHEMGHIELSHCLNTVKFNLLTDKVGLGDLGILADQATRLLYSHSYSKTQEEEADEYAFNILKASKYNPSSLADSFIIFQTYENSIIEKNYNQNQKTHLNIFRDYFSSHPPLSLRIEKNFEKAEKWWKNNKNQERYNGIKNYNEQIPLSQLAYEEEWISYTEKDKLNSSNNNVWDKYK